MKKNQRNNRLLVINMISSGIFQLLMLLVPIITTPYVARIFDPSRLGMYASSYSLVTIFVTFSMFGLPIYGSRRIAQTKDVNARTKIFFNLWIVQITGAIFCFFIFNISVLLFRMDKIYSIQSFLIIAAIFDISWFYIGLEEIRKNIFRNFITKLLATISIFFIIKSSDQLYTYTTINVSAVFLGNLTMFTTIIPFISTDKSNFKFNLKKNTIISSFRLMVPMFLDNVKNASSRIILSSLSGNYQVGIFDQGSKIIVIVLGILSSTSNAVSPRMSYLVGNDQIEELRNYFNNFIKAISIFSIVSISGIIAVAEFFVPIFFGEGYMDVLPILIIGSFSILFGTYNVFLMNGMIIPLSLDNQLVKASTYSLLIIIVLNFFFSNILGSIGAMISFVISNIILTGIYCYFLRKYIVLSGVLQNLFISLSIIAVCTFLVRLLKVYIRIENNFINFFLFGIISVLISLVIISFFYVLNKSKLLDKQK